MLSDDAIDNLMQPIIDRQESINEYIIGEIAKRIREIGTLLPSDIHKLESLMKSGADVRRINEKLSTLTHLQIRDIKKLIKDVALDAYVDAKPFYDYRSVPYLPFEKNLDLQKVVSAVQIQTADTYKNLSNTTAFMIRDLKHPNILKPTSIAETYRSVIDEAIQATTNGTIDYGTAMRRTLRQLVESGLRKVWYSPESGRRYSKRLDSAVRQNLLDGIRQLNQKVQQLVGKQFGSDGVELSAHPFSAPDHEPFQGRQFTNEQFENLQNNLPFKDIKGHRYTAVDRIIGEWNCRHFAWSIVIGFAEPNYSEKQLREMAARNQKGYTLPNGKHLTMYECTQLQRQLETKIRQAKDGQIAALRAGDLELAREYQAKINKYTKQYKAFSKDCGIQTRPDKLTVSGYSRIKVS